VPTPAPKPAPQPTPKPAPTPAPKPAPTPAPGGEAKSGTGGAARRQLPEWVSENKHVKALQRHQDKYMAAQRQNENKLAQVRRQMETADPARKRQLEVQAAKIEKDLSRTQARIETNAKETRKYAEHLVARAPWYKNHEEPASKEDQTGRETEFKGVLNNHGTRAQPIDAPQKNYIDNRSAAEYHKVIEQFQLPRPDKPQIPERYKPEFYKITRIDYYRIMPDKEKVLIDKKQYLKLDKRHRSMTIEKVPVDYEEYRKLPEKGRFGKTYCNIFVWDVTRAMVGPKEAIPHIVNGQEMQVNKLVPWLTDEGKKNGWRRIDARMAYQMATEGHPTIAIWKNPNEEHSGHVTMVRPGNPQENGPAIAQAGTWVMDASHLKAKHAFRERAVEFWYHE